MNEFIECLLGWCKNTALRRLQLKNNQQSKDDFIRDDAELVKFEGTIGHILKQICKK